MSRRQKDPLRALSDEERAYREHLSRSARARAGMVARAKALRAVADGRPSTEAARLAGRRSGDGVAQLVARFNRRGVPALEDQHAGGPAPGYPATERERILAAAQRAPDPQQDQTATWSLTTLQRAVRHAPDGLPQGRTSTIWCVLHEEGWSWQRTRTGGPTGTALRLRKRGRVPGHAPDADAHKG